MSEKKMPESICIDFEFFEHLLDCLADQKWIHEKPPKEQKKIQKTIDIAWKKAWKMYIKHNQEKK